MMGRDLNGPHNPRAALGPNRCGGVGLAADQLTQFLADGPFVIGITGFVPAMVSVTWAWTNCTWLASDYDTDDRVYRVATMVQLVGMIVGARPASNM
jgi:hypothetical protein